MIKNLNRFFLNYLNYLNTSKNLIKYRYTINFKFNQNSKFNKKLYLNTLLTVPVLYAKSNNDDEDKSTLSHRNRFNFIADVVEKVLPSIVQIEIRQNSIYGPVTSSSGSGFIVSQDGFILTNAHVVRNFNNQDIYVKTRDGYSYKARLIKIDKSADLAVIKIDAKNLNSVKLGNSDQVRTGEFVVALGSPLTLNNTVTSGVVSNPFRDGKELGLTNELFYIQTDAIITHGNSGGPLVNLDGEVVGINSMKAAPGISFAIPIKYAKEFVETGTKSIASKYRYLGMKMISINSQIYDLFNSQSNSDIKIPNGLRHGCLIIEVAPNSPAEKAGLKRGDIIIEANSSLILKNSDLFNILKQTSKLNLIILRNNVQYSFNVQADEREG